MTRASFRVRLRDARRLRELATAAVLVACPLGVSAASWAPPAQARSSTAADFSTLSARADAAREAGRLDEAAALYRKALSARPEWKEGWWALGTILYDQDSHADAARAFRRLLVLDPKNGTAHLMLGLCEYQVDRDASAMEHIQAARRLGVQKDGELLHVLTYHEAMLLLRDGRYERALEVLQPLVAESVDDENLDLALGMGVLLMRPKDVRLEAPASRQIVMRAGRAERHQLAKEFDAARGGYSTLAQEVPTFPNVHYAYGRFLLGTDDLENAVVQFLEEIKNSPDHVRARMLIAAARYRVDSAAGIPFALEVVKLQPRYPFGHYLLGLLYFDAGDIGRATPELEAAARIVPQEAQFQFALGNAYARAGRKEDAARARAAFQRLRQEDSTREPAISDKLRRRDLDDVPQPKQKGGG
jgi:tetratricopeptide (TPR) repeat protein